MVPSAKPRDGTLWSDFDPSSPFISKPCDWAAAQGWRMALEPAVSLGSLPQATLVTGHYVSRMYYGHNPRATS